VASTLSVAIIGQVVSIFLALMVGILGRQTTWFGSFIKVAAYNVQAYPIVAIAPIIFILFGDGFFSRLLIAAMICYFPILLSVLGIMSEPVKEMYQSDLSKILVALFLIGITLAVYQGLLEAAGRMIGKGVTVTR